VPLGIESKAARKAPHRVAAVGASSFCEEEALYDDKTRSVRG
jgi:hypothetical protein